MRKLVTKMLAMMMLTGFIMITAAQAQTVQVTFRVDMSEVDEISPLGVHIAGSFQGWNPNSTEMTQPPFGKVYTYTAELTPGETILWKYINGTTWGDVEQLAGAGACVTGNDNNRFLVVPDVNTTLEIVCFGSCSSCSENIDITFQVDMSEQIVTTGVFLAGEFNGWNSSAWPMTDMGNGIWSRTVSLLSGSSWEYKYINSGNWEEISGPCTQNENRLINVPEQDTVLDLVCFGSCIACAVPTVPVTFQVDMSNTEISPDGIHIKGTFNDWNPAADEMTPIGNGIYEITLEMSQGDYIEFKYVNGNTDEGQEWIPQECSFNNNRFLEIPDVSTTLDLVCFGQCAPCGNPPTDVEITFVVDMSQQSVSPDGVHIAGTFQGWNPGTTLMTDQGGGIYSWTGSFQSGYYHEYKFINGNIWDYAETIPEPCAFNGNRFIYIPEVNTTVAEVCFSSCESCPLPAEVEVTFQVDMSEETVSGDGVHLIGSFNNFDPAATAMALQRNGVYEATLTLTEGDLHQYKFVNGNTLAGEETVPVECADASGYRELTVPADTATLDVVCFGSCAPCVPPPVVDVDFFVDMSNEVVSDSGVFLAGSFNGFDPEATQMEDIGDNVYKATLSLEVGSHVTYKFLNGNSFEGEEEVPPACGEPDGFGGYNRYFDVTDPANVLDQVCFSSCSECVAPVEVEVTFLVDMQNEDVDTAGVHIAGSFQGWNTTSSPMTLLEDQVYTYTASLIAGEYHEYKFLNGNTTGDYEEISGNCTSQDGNRMITIPETDTIPGVVCFGSCESCPLPAEVEVTFQVDMSQQTVAPEGVHIAGTFNFFSTSETPMTDMGDGIWVATLTLTEGDYIIYKYVNGDTFQGFEIVPPECSQEDGNRELTVPGENLTINPVCFGSCEPCVPPPTVDVTFYVDMSNEIVSPDGVHVAGSFNGFSTTETPMTDADLDNIYEATVTLVVGDHVTYKFINGNTFDGEEEVPPACGEPDGFSGYNRYFDVTDPANVLDQVCFSSCSECVAPVEVTFQVDMSNEIVSPDGVHVAGSFNGFDPAATTLTDQGDGVYTATLALTAGDHVSYKYINGTSYDFEENVPAECGEDNGLGGFNRYVDVPETAYTIPLHCFSSCGACVAPSHEIALFEGWNSLSSYIMPDDNDIESVMDEISAQLVIMQTMTEVYFPDAQLNTIITWDSQSAYKIKVSQDVLLNITGTPEQNKTLQLEEGWNLIPVISENPVNAEDLFGDVMEQIVVVKGIAETSILWPEYEINTLVNLLPGKAYYVKTSQAVEITFP